MSFIYIIIHFVDSEKHDDANNINLQSNQMNRNETSSLSDGHSDEFSMLDSQKQTPKNEYTRTQLMELRHNETTDIIEKAKNMRISERILRNNAAKKLADPKCGPAKGKMITAKCGPVVRETPNEPNVDDFWSKATTSNRNAAAADQKDDSTLDFDLPNPWAKSGFDDPTDFSFGSNVKVDNWLNAGRGEMPTQFSQCDDFSIEPSNQSNPLLFSNERKLTETSSLVSDVSTKSALRSKLLDKTAKLKQTLSNLKQQNNNLN